MPITVNVHRTKPTVVFWEFAGRWTWDEVYQAQDSSNATIAQHDAPAVVICKAIDNIADRQMPEKSLLHFRKLVERANAHTILNVIVVDSYLWRSITKMGIALSPIGKVALASTDDEALRMAEQAFANHTP
ncbi:MAG: hypothetical protein AAF125_10760 [Chloroflexota bacterium]